MAINAAASSSSACFPAKKAPLLLLFSRQFLFVSTAALVVLHVGCRSGAAAGTPKREKKLRAGGLQKALRAAPRLICATWTPKQSGACYSLSSNAEPSAPTTPLGLKARLTCR